jgi:small conductance mechanosensitive channel
MLANVALVFLIRPVAYYTAKFFQSLTVKIISNSNRSPAGIYLLSGTVYILVLSIGFIFAVDAQSLDKVVSSLPAAVGISGMVLGFAFQDLSANFMVARHDAIINLTEIIKKIILL